VRPPDLYHRIYTAIFSNTLNVSRIIAALAQAISHYQLLRVVVSVPEMKTQAVSRCVIAARIVGMESEACYEETERERERWGGGARGD